MTPPDGHANVDQVETSRSTGLPSVSDHRVFLFFPFSIGSSRRCARDVATLCGHLASAPLSRLAASTLMPSWICDRASKAEGSIWQERRRNVTMDLHPHLRRLAGGDDAAEPKINRAHCFELSAGAVNLLTGMLGHTGRGLRLKLGRAASARLGAGLDEAGTNAQLVAAIKIRGATIQFWQSGIGFLILELEYESEQTKDQAGLILELNHALCRVHSSGSAQAFWQKKVSQSEYEEQPGPSLDALATEVLRVSLGQLLQTDGPTRTRGRALLRPDWRRDHRLFVYSAVAFDGSSTKEERDRYALRLSHRFNSDYSVALTEHTNLYAPFEEIVHSASFEGGAVVVSPASNAEFINNFIDTAVRPGYLPMTIVALHELRYLLRLSQESVAHAPEGRGFARQIHNLAQLGREFACFKLYFRFSQASHIDHQNATYAMWRKALQLSQLLDEATSDVDQAYRVLSERRWRVYGTLGTFFVVYISLTHSVNLVLDAVMNREDILASAQVQVMTGLMTVQQFDAVRHGLTIQQQIGYLIALVAAAGIAGLVFKLAPSSRL